MSKDFPEWSCVSIVVPVVVIADHLGIGRRAAAATSELVVAWPAIVGIKIYQWTKVTNGLSGDGWRRRNHE